MNKRLVFVLILLSICLMISIGSYVIVSYISEDLSSELNAFRVSAENGNENEALEALDTCIDKLKLYEKIYAVFLDHNLFENIMITIPTVRHLYESGNIDESMDKCFESIEILKIIVHEQKLSLENVF